MREGQGSTGHLLPSLRAELLLHGAGIDEAGGAGEDGGSSRLNHRWLSCSCPALPLSLPLLQLQTPVGKA
jgi:hypothetical protein